MNYPVIKSKSARRYQICMCCVMDTSDEDIVFDENGICMRCKEYKERIEPEWNHSKDIETKCKKQFKKIAWRPENCKKIHQIPRNIRIRLKTKVRINSAIGESYFMNNSGWEKNTK